MAKYSVERVIQVWNDDTGERLEFKPDADGLGMWTLRFVADDGKVGSEITLTTEQVHLMFPAALKETGYELA